MEVRCRYCGTFTVPDDAPAVETLHAHAMSVSHQTMMRLAKELDEATYVPPDFPWRPGFRLK